MNAGVNAHLGSTAVKKRQKGTKSVKRELKRCRIAG